ncbi:HNH endonuclease signature motif containing protein [Micrococcus sp. IITD107]|uniref:HNH endonuclease signature motif containing protein n=1 Tax=Micrococcus sp. IITD107 TaxID=3342790 RepID=UPI0035B82B89
MKYDHAVDVRLKRAKSKELKDPALIASVWARDCTDDPAVAAVGRCRYCKTELKRKDTRSQNRPEMDHVDPKLAAGVTNVVLSCYQCNRTKGQRTPEQAGMTLHPAPRQTDAAAADRTPQAAADAGAGSKPGAAGPHTDVRAGAERFPVPPALEPPSSSTGTSEQDQPGTSGGRPDGDALLGRTRGHERPGRAGQGRAGSGKGKGQGSGGAGLGEGSGQGSGQGGRRRRRGSRGRGRSGQPQTRPDHKQPSGGDPPVQGTNEPPIGRAGDAPEVLTGGRYGSPYFGWSGPPSFVEESVCVEHGLDKPCRKCEGGEQ